MGYESSWDGGAPSKGASGDAYRGGIGSGIVLWLLGQHCPSGISQRSENAITYYSQCHKSVFAKLFIVAQMVTRIENS